MGQDKADLVLEGQTWVQHLANRLAPPGVPVVVATRDPNGPGADSGYPVVVDAIPGAGPMAAMEAVLGAIQTPYALFVPCDMLSLPADLGDRMLRFVPGVHGVVARLGEQIQPFPVLLADDLREPMRAWLRAGFRRADHWLDHVPARIVPYAELFPGDPTGRGLANLNDSSALHEWESTNRGTRGDD